MSRKRAKTHIESRDEWVESNGTLFGLLPALAEATPADWDYIREHRGSTPGADYDSIRRGLRNNETELRKRSLDMQCVGCGKDAAEVKTS